LVGLDGGLILVTSLLTFGRTDGDGVLHRCVGKTDGDGVLHRCVGRTDGDGVLHRCVGRTDGDDVLYRCGQGNSVDRRDTNNNRNNAI